MKYVYASLILGLMASANSVHAQIWMPQQNIWNVMQPHFACPNGVCSTPVQNSMRTHPSCPNGVCSTPIQNPMPFATQGIPVMNAFPGYSAPVYSQPVYSQPVYSQPVYSQPIPWNSQPLIRSSASPVCVGPNCLRR